MKIDLGKKICSHDLAFSNVDFYEEGMVINQIKQHIILSDEEFKILIEHIKQVGLKKEMLGNLKDEE